MTVGAIEHRSLPIADLQAAMALVTRRVIADLDVPGFPEPHLVSDPDFAGSGRPGDPPAADVVVMVGSRRFPAGLERGIEAACAATMAALQDDVVDHLWHPWPEVVELGSGEVLGVLDVDLAEPGEIARWRLRDRPVCAVGFLQSTCAALGWRIGRPRG
jgi:hypothetical protein